MLSTCCKTLLAFALAVFFAAASPIQTLAERQDDDYASCANTAAIFISECWSSQNVDFFLSDPTTGWWATTPKCPTDQPDGVGCCIENEPWSTCFIRLGTSFAGQDCTMVNAQKCTWDYHVSPTLPQDQDQIAQVRYVMDAIFSVNDFFNTYNTALLTAFDDTLAIVTPLTSTIDSVVPSVSITNVLTALTVALAFLGAPELGGAILGLETVVRYAATVLTLGLQQAPGVAKSLWPAGTTDSQTYQISALDQQLETIKDQMSDILNSGLANIMNDLPTFVNFTGNGAFTGNQTLSLPNATNGLDFALKTYVTSKSLQQNGWAGILLEVVSAENATHQMNGPNCANITGGILCSETGDKSHYDQSDATFWSPRTGNLYLLSPKGNSWSYPALSAINANGWADIGTLFDGSYTCTFEGKAGGPILNFNADETLNMDCLSQLPIYIFSGRPCPQKAADGSCLFGSTD